MKLSGVIDCADCERRFQWVAYVKDPKHPREGDYIVYDPKACILNARQSNLRGTYIISGHCPKCGAQISCDYKLDNKE